jgi:hypothetical protein
VVGHHDQQAALEQPGSLQALHHESQLPVGVAHLQEMAQMVVVGEAGVVEALGVVDPLDRVLAGGAALVSGRQVDPRLVGEQRVVQVERRP